MTSGPGEEPRDNDAEAPASATRPSYLRRRGLIPHHVATARYALRRTVTEFVREDMLDEAAGLTYWSVLSLLPAVLAVVSVLGVVGQAESTTRALLDFMHELVDDDVADILAQPISDFASRPGAGWLLIAGLVGAMWFASNYVQAFTRALNRMYRVEEGRPVGLSVFLGFLLTALLVVLLAVVAVLLVVSGTFVEAFVRFLELPPEVVVAWTVGKWPLLILLELVAIALLYYFSPNVAPRAFSLITPGALVALAVGSLATAGLGVFVRNFPTSNYYYGALTGVLVFLLWLLAINIVLLFGAQLNAELERGVELEEGLPAERELQLRIRSTRSSLRRSERYERLIHRAEVLRRTGGTSSREREK
ncbi:MAG: YihY/virulence factor BrkB family protein [Actinomycetota bacterium]